jgi:hypothetical protein
MTIAQSLNEFNSNVAQCDSLIVTAHRSDSAGNGFFPQRDREQITVGAFLNLFIAWEAFIETALCDFMMGSVTVGGTRPKRHVRPPNRAHSSRMVIHTQRYFDYANHNNVQRMASLFFADGYPFVEPLRSIDAELADLKSIRNACAHLSSTTTASLEALAGRIMGQPQPGISVYRLLTSVNERNRGTGTTVYSMYRDILRAAATLIARG